MQTAITSLPAFLLLPKHASMLNTTSIPHKLLRITAAHLFLLHAFASIYEAYPDLRLDRTSPQLPVTRQCIQHTVEQPDKFAIWCEQQISSQ